LLYLSCILYLALEEYIVFSFIYRVEFDIRLAIS